MHRMSHTSPTSIKQALFTAVYHIYDLDPRRRDHELAVDGRGAA